MTKTIFITGSTDGIGLAAAKAFHDQGHRVILHGRSPTKLAEAQAALGDADGHLADMSDLSQVRQLADTVAQTHGAIDVLINNAGVLKAPQTRTADGHDIRFVVNTFAPVVLAQALAPTMPSDGRVIHLSSAAQATIDLDALNGAKALADMDAYAQSKLALTMWSQEAGRGGPLTHIAVNPGSLLATNMVRDGFGLAGNDISIGADILVRLALAPEMADRSGQYFDNDAGRFGAPHGDAAVPARVAAVLEAIETAIAP